MHVLRLRDRGNIPQMLRKLLWTSIYGAIGALSTVVSRRGASVIWRRVTGEEPPAKK